MKAFLKNKYPILCVVFLVVIYVVAEPCDEEIIDGFSLFMSCWFAIGLMWGAKFIYDKKWINTFSNVVFIIMGVSLYVVLPVTAFVVWNYRCGMLFLYLVTAFVIFAYFSGMIIKTGKYFKLSIVLRKLSLLFTILITVVFIIIGVSLMIKPQLLVSHEISTAYEWLIRLAGFLCVEFWLRGVVKYMIDGYRKLYVFSNYLKPCYILYLRRFSNDDNPTDLECLELLTKNDYGLDVMRIGNPKRFFMYAFYFSTIYLNTTNWKEQLRNYIKCSKVVFSQIDISEGVVWEIFENTDYISKYIYNIPNVSLIPQIIENIRPKVPNESLTFFSEFCYVLNFIYDKHDDNESMLFCFEQDGVFYSRDVGDMLELKIRGAKSDSLKTVQMIPSVDSYLPKIDNAKLPITTQSGVARNPA